MRGYGAFVSTNHVEVEETTGTGQGRPVPKKVVAFKRAIIAAGSQAVRLPFMPEDPRVVDSTGALALKEVPKRMLILGGGIIGLEMGTVYSTLGAPGRGGNARRPDAGCRPRPRQIWQKMNAKRFDHIMLKTKTVAHKGHARRHRGHVCTSRGGWHRPAPQTYDLVLQAWAAPQQEDRRRESRRGRDGAWLHQRGTSRCAPTCRTSLPSATSSASPCWRTRRCTRRMAAEVIAGELQGNKELASAAFNARVIPSVAYTDPEVAWVGLTEDQAKAQGIKVKKGMFPWTASGRAIANGRDEGVTKLLFDDSPEAHGHGKILGGGMVGTHAGDMIGEVALAIEMGADAVDIGKTIHPHPTLGKHRYGGGSGAWQLHGCAASAEVNRPDASNLQARTGNSSGFCVWRLGNICCGGNNCINVQLCALCHAHQGVAPCTRLQLSRTQGHNRTTMRAAAAAAAPAAAVAKPKLFNPRHPERTLLYQTIAEHFETWHELASAGQFDPRATITPKSYVSQAFRKHLSVASSPTAFARRGDDCGHDYFVASPARPGCPPPRATPGAWWKRRRTSRTTSFPPAGAPVGAVGPKRLRYFMHPRWDGPVLNMVLRIFLRVHCANAASQLPRCSGCEQGSPAHRRSTPLSTGSAPALNEHVHFHVCVVDGCLSEVPGGRCRCPRRHHPGGHLSTPPPKAWMPDAVAQVQGYLAQTHPAPLWTGPAGVGVRCWAKDMLAYQHSGFWSMPVHQAYDRAALERLLRYCARPPFAMERVCERGRCAGVLLCQAAQRPPATSAVPKADELTLTPLELIDRIAALVPPPRTHRHRLLWCAGTELAAQGRGGGAGDTATTDQASRGQTEPARHGRACPQWHRWATRSQPTPEPAPPKRAPAHYLWAVLIARIYRRFQPLSNLRCQMRLIAFITEGTQIRRILGSHRRRLGEPPQTGTRTAVVQG